MVRRRVTDITLLEKTQDSTATVELARLHSKRRRPSVVLEATMTLYQQFPMLPGQRAQAWLHRPAFRRPRHFHAEPEVNFVFRGHAVVGVGERSHELCAGDALLLRPGQDHELLEASDDLELVVAAATPEFAVRVGRSLAHAGAPLVRLSPSEMASTRERLLALVTPVSAEEHEKLVGDVLGEVERRLPRARSASQRVLEVGDERLDLTVAELAQGLRMHPSEVSRRAHSQLGVRLVEFRARQRLLRFIGLVDSGLSLTRASLEASFGSYAQCHRAFRQYLGCAPRAYFGGLRSTIDGQTLLAPPQPDFAFVELDADRRGVDPSPALRASASPSARGGWRAGAQ